LLVKIEPWSSHKIIRQTGARNYGHDAFNKKLITEIGNQTMFD